MHWSIERKWTAIAFSSVMLLLGGISLISYQNATRLAESANQVRQTHAMLETLTTILSGLNEAEAGRRGYILFDDKAELERYQQAVESINSELNQLQQLSTGDAIQQEQLKTLRQLIAQRSDLAQQSIRLHQQTGGQSDQTPLMVASTRNRREIQKLVAIMQQQEQQSLQQWVKQSQTSIQLRMLLESLGTFLTFFILFSVFASLYQQMVKRQQAEALQQKLAQEKELGELKLQFFSMVSHEFRTPLSSILGSAQILDETLQPLVEKQKLKSLDRIRSAAQLMTQLLSDILTLARAEAGKLEFNPKPVEIQTFCLNLLEDMQALITPRHSIRFTMQGECTYASVDEKLLYSILSNLLSNAIKYSPDGGAIAFRLICEADCLVFEISDAGIGISPEIKTALYEPFQRGSNVGRIVGTGLGLAVVKKCLNLHDGEISVESDINLGTTFRVKLEQDTGL